MRDDHGEAREYRCGEDSFYLYRYDGLCYDDEGFSYRFGEDGFYYNTEEGRPYDSGGFCCDENDIRLEYAEVPQPNESFSLGEHSFVPGMPRVKIPTSRTCDVVDLADTEPEEIGHPWRPRASVISRQEEGEVVEAAESADDIIPSLLVGSLSLQGSSVAQPLAVSKAISDEISCWVTNGISTEAFKAISKEFPLEYVDTEFAIKPPKLDGWIGRWAQLKPDKGLLKTSNVTEDYLA
ncbi:hypothetical protein OUZ56_005984 [Daphnia magna]|uniref:Uncharacterized protein n=1 Tax=Daphnia magna TaxID=35525 RepID=A0ABQ9YUB7_9CRUS|nr:hypothetical protein OUZ56_005984 [Daphnia magna]